MGKTERFALDDNWVLLVDGGVVDDGGFSGGHVSSGGGVALPEGSSPQQLAIASREFEAEERSRAAAPRHVRIEVRRGDVSVVLADATSSALDGTVELYWPPIVSPAGLLLRHARASVTSDRSDRRLHWDTAAQRPWLITPSGEVTQLPFELGVSPLAALPDGRYLLPGADPLWRDDYDEPLSALAVDGQVEPLTVDGEPLHPSRLVALADAAWATGRKRDAQGWPLEDFPFWTQRARIEGDQLVVLLADYAVADWADEGPYQEEPMRWLTATVDLAGRSMRRLAHGTVLSDGTPAIPW